MEQAGSTAGAGSARPSPPVVILLSQRAGKPRPYKACHLGSHLPITKSLYYTSPYTLPYTSEDIKDNVI